VTNRQLIVQALTRPYPVSVPMVVLVSLVPFYLFLDRLYAGRPLHTPEIALDRAMPLWPAWAIVYGALYGFLIVLPVLVIRQQEQIRRTVFAYLTVWIAAYVCFVAYPTVAPRPEEVIGDGFAVWGLRSLYGADPPYNCFPSLHVAHSFVSAFACARVHRGVGIGAIACAVLVAISTVYTKQHYVLDVVAGLFLSCVAYVIFLRKHIDVPELDRRAAPVLAIALIAAFGLAIAASWVVYRLTAPAF
jgi:membrane-associated phospholipid phosphatase